VGLLAKSEELVGLRKLLGKAQHAVSLLARGKLTRGYCPICETKVFFAKEGPWLRDQFICISCRSIPRQRALLHVLQQHFPSWRDSRIHESSPGGVSSEKLQKECPNLIFSQYFSDVPRGHIRNGQQSEDLESLTFSDNSFDLVITQDVFEHILRPQLAFAEIARTLRPGGAHVFTAPWYRGKKTVVRARAAASGEIEHLMKPDYHGNPIDPGGSLVITEWGDEICDFIRDASGLTTTIYTFSDPKLGLEAEFLDVFVSRKVAVIR
jgi:hypothetical protein